MLYWLTNDTNHSPYDECIDRPKLTEHKRTHLSI